MSLNEGRDVNPGDTANSMQEAVPWRNCPIEWTVEAPQQRSLRSLGALVNDIPDESPVQPGNTACDDSASHAGSRITGGSQMNQSTQG